MSEKKVSSKSKKKKTTSSKKRKRDFIQDGSLYLTILLILLCGVGVVVFRDHVAGIYNRENDKKVVEEDELLEIENSQITVDEIQKLPHATGDEEKSAEKKEQSKKKPVLCFVIDDVGHNQRDLERFLQIPGKVTFAVLPGLSGSREAAREVKAAGQELLLHLPMEALSGVYPGPGLLKETMGDRERLKCLEENLDSVPGAVGVNNHMGSKGTSSYDLSYWLLKTLKQKNLFFLDSRTVADSQIRNAAKNLNWNILERNSMFLDNDKDEESIIEAIEVGKTTAQKKGHAIMIGHAVTSELADVMLEYYPSLVEEGFIIENLSYLLNESRGQDESTRD